MNVVRAGVGVLLIRDGKVLLGKRHEDAKKADSELHGEGTWTCPGGKLDFHETLFGQAIKEVKEETGIDVKKLEIVSIGNDMVPDNQFITIGFLATEFSGKPRVMEPDEIVEWEWFPLDDLPKNTFPPSRKMIMNYLDKEIYKH
ncbi:MAG: NUDIX domain-containing protein [Candidatus Aenigmarchaeota archaeon]|nr:NUDIX domain-containing protein [Candidatus Aenigmarchaeota archaeon]